MIAHVLCLAVLVRQQTLDPQAIYKKALPSVMTLTALNKNGEHVLGTAFLALRDGTAVTAWHVIKDAASVSAKFSDGEVFEVSGLVDKDEKRDVAIIRVKVADRPLLQFASGDPEVGSKCFLIGAPQGLEFSISDGIVSQLRIFDGIKQLQFTCAQNPGNSGGPLIDDTGKVLGIADWHLRDSQGLNFAIAGTYAKGLDSTLPTQPWNTVTSQPIPGSLATVSALDACLALSLRILIEAGVEADVVRANVITQDLGYHDGVPSGLYQHQSRVDDQVKALTALIGSDPDREQARSQLLAQLRDMSSGLDLIAQSIREARANRGWNATADDLESRGSAAEKRALSPGSNKTAVLELLSSG